MVDLYGGVGSIMLLARYRKIERFFTSNGYISSGEAVHISELEQHLLTNEKLRDTFLNMCNSKMVQSANHNYFYFNTKMVVRPRNMILLIFASIGLVVLMLVVCIMISS